MRRRCHPGDPKRPPETKNYGDKEEQGTMKKTVAMTMLIMLSVLLGLRKKIGLIQQTIQLYR